MDFLDFNRLVKKDDISDTYLFKGTEEYLMDRYVKLIKDKYIDENFSMMNYIEIDVNGSFDNILNACETLPFMSERKLIVIKDVYELFQNDKSISDKLMDYLEDVSHENIFIIKDKADKLKKTTKLYKELNKKNKVVEFNRLNKVQLKTFIKSIIIKNEKTLENAELLYFIEKSGYLTYRSEKSLFELENELNKIANFSKTNIITKEDIDKSLLKDLDINIFNFIDSLMNRDTKNSLVIFNNMNKMGEPVPKILFMLIRHFRLLIKYITYSSMGYSRGDISSILKISPYELKKIDANSRKFNFNYVKDVLEKLLEFDIKQKTVPIDEKIQMENFIVNITKLM